MLSKCWSPNEMSKRRFERHYSQMMERNVLRVILHPQTASSLPEPHLEASNFSLPSIPEAQGSHWHQCISQAHPTEHLLARNYQRCHSKSPDSHIMHTLVCESCVRAEMLRLVLLKTHSGQNMSVLTISAGSKILQIPTTSFWHSRSRDTQRAEANPVSSCKELCIDQLRTPQGLRTHAQYPLCVLTTAHGQLSICYHIHPLPFSHSALWCQRLTTEATFLRFPSYWISTGFSQWEPGIVGGVGKDSGTEEREKPGYFFTSFCFGQHPQQQCLISRIPDATRQPLLLYSQVPLSSPPS